jgi:tetratricopeptide (TPR) repeat protein
VSGRDIAVQRHLISSQSVTIMEISHVENVYFGSTVVGEPKSTDDAMTNGLALRSAAKYNEALDEFFSGLRANEDLRMRAILLGHIGLTKGVMGDEEVARAYFVLARESAVLAGELELVARSGHLMHVYSISLGDFQLAERYEGQAVATARQTGNQNLLAQCLVALSRASSLNRNHEEAANAALEAAEIYRSLKDTEHLIEASIEAGSSLANANRSVEAKATLSEASDLAAGCGDRAAEARALAQLAWASLLDRFDAAWDGRAILFDEPVAYATRAREIYQELGLQEEVDKQDRFIQKELDRDTPKG